MAHQTERSSCTAKLIAPAAGTGPFRKPSVAARVVACRARTSAQLKVSPYRVNRAPLGKRSLRFVNSVVPDLVELGQDLCLLGWLSACYGTYRLEHVLQNLRFCKTLRVVLRSKVCPPTGARTSASACSVAPRRASKIGASAAVARLRRAAAAAIRAITPTSRPLARRVTTSLLLLSEAGHRLRSNRVVYLLI